MKNIKEKQLLVNFAKALGQDVDPTLVKDVIEYNEIKANAVKSIKSSGLGEMFAAFKELKNEKIEQPNQVVLEQEYPIPPSIDDLMILLNEAKEEEREIEEILVEVAEETIKEIESLKDENLIDKASKLISEAPKNSFQQPEPIVVPENLDAIRNKIKFLEQWISKVSATGAGSGETKFRFLDDVDRDSIGNSDQILRYRPASPTEYGKFFFGNLSGDQGPVRSLQFDERGQGANANVTAGLVAWNSFEDCLNVYQNNTILQVGLENYIRVHNHTGNTIPNGTFVQFAGVDLGVDAPFVIPYVNNISTTPLLAVGVITHDLPDQALGKATVLGLVRNLNTTGNDVGESWQIGDLLWASPTYPGKFTKYKPTLPIVPVSVAAVMQVGTTDGQILVRPTIWPRLFFGEFYSTRRQIAASPNQATQVFMGQTLSSSGVNLTANAITVMESGLYKFDMTAQITSTNSSQKSIVFWLKKNDANIPFSGVRRSLSDNGSYSTVTFGETISLIPQDNVKIFYAVTDTSIYLDSPAPIDGSPNIASIKVTVTQPSL